VTGDPADGPVTASGPDGDIVVWEADGTVVALPAACPHRGAHLGDATVQDGCLVCPLHGWRWRPDGTNAGTGDGPAQPEASATAVPVHQGVDGPLLWVSGSSPSDPSHPPVDLAGLLPTGPGVADRSWALDLGEIDPAMVIGNAFAGAHLPTVHGRNRRLDGLELTADLARVDHLDAAGGRTRFTAYRSSQLAVEVATDRDDLAFGVLFTVDVGPGSGATIRYRAAGPGAEALVRRFARRHRDEVEADLAVFRRQRPERGRFWGPEDGALQAYEGWVASLP